MLHRHKIVSVESEPSGAFVSPRIDDEKEAPKMDETDENGEWEGELMKING